MPHSVVKAITSPLAKVLSPIMISGSGRVDIPVMAVIPYIDYGTARDERGYIADLVTINSKGVQRRVCCLEATALRLVGEVWSDAAGNYRFDNLLADQTYIVVSVDHENKYDPVGKAPLYPTRYPS